MSKRLFATLSAALIAICIVGLASAQAPPAAPTGVTALASGEGFVISWDSSDAASHWVAWMSNDDYAAARAAGDWTKALKYDHVPSGDTHVISSERLAAGQDYWIIVGSVSGSSAVAWGEWHTATALHGLSAEEASTYAYVMDAIAYYDSNGREATSKYYNSTESVEDERYLVLLDDADGAVLAMFLFRDFLGEKSSYTEHFRRMATGAGVWTEHQGFYLAATNTGIEVARGPMRSYVIRHDGLIFISGHSVLSDNVAEATQDYVNRAIAHYEANGLAATIEHYNSHLSVDGHFYLFLIGADDNYLAHPIFPHLIGTDIKDVVGSDGQELGKEIAAATEAGGWVEYLWPHPVTRQELPKVTWAIRHDGLIFASGYYTGGSEDETPPWRNVADPEQYTEDYVNRAIARYERDGLQAMLNYYNSVASFEGQWYLFATDANDVYHVHPLLPRLIGTDINDVVGDDGYELGKALAAAPDGGEGVWVEYLWPHPVTLQKVPKRGYAVRHDGMLFASGYYPRPADPASEVQAYVQKAIDYYDANGADDTLAYYRKPASIEGEYALLILDDQGVIQVFALFPEFVGWDVSTFKGPVAGEPIGEWLLDATPEGHWFDYLYPNTGASEVLVAHQWAIRHEGYIFTSAYFVPLGEPGPAD